MTLNFDIYAQEGNNYLQELARKLGYPEDRERTARILSAVLKALRDVLPPSENMQLMAQLPMFLKAVYIDGYTLGRTHRKPRQIKEFLGEVKKYYNGTADHNSMTEADVENAVRTILSSLRQYVSMGEIEGIIAQLPKEIKKFVSRAVTRIGSYDFFL